MNYVNLETVNQIDEHLGHIIDQERRSVLTTRLNKLLIEISNQLLSELSDHSDKIK